MLDEFGRISAYNPHVSASKIINGPETGIGATRECVFEDGGRIEEEIIKYEPGSNYTVEFIGVGSMPLKQNQVRISVEERGDSTAVTMAAMFKTQVRIPRNCDGEIDDGVSLPEHLRGSS